MNSTLSNTTFGGNGTDDGWDPATESAVLGVGIGFLLLYMACCVVVTRRVGVETRIEHPALQLPEFDVPDGDDVEDGIEAQATI